MLPTWARCNPRMLAASIENYPDKRKRLSGNCQRFEFLSAVHQQGRFANMEFLVHNISHSDLVVELSGDSALTTHYNSMSLLARPKFSLFNIVSQNIVHALDHVLHPTAAQTNMYERAMESPRFEFREHCSSTSHPVGFRYDICSI